MHDVGAREQDSYENLINEDSNIRSIMPSFNLDGV